MSEIEHHHRAFCEYSLVFKGNTPRTIKWFQETNGYFIKETGVETLDAITRPVIERYVMNGRMNKNWSIRTVRNRLSALSIFLDWCVKQELIDTNPAQAIDLPKLPKSLPKHLGKDDAFALLEWTRNFRYAYQIERVRAHAVIATFMFTGIRRAELFNLKIEDVRFNEKTIFIRSGKGDKDRIIPMSQDLSVVLSNYLKERDRLKRQCPNFFVCLNADKPMGEKALQRLVQKLRGKSGIHFYPHMLRHTFATLMLEGGSDIFAISKMLGHSDIKTTTIYLSVTTNHLKSEISKHPLALNPHVH